MSTFDTCAASTSDFTFLAECTLPNNHVGQDHYDAEHEVSWPYHTRYWVVVGPYEQALAYAESRHWIDDPPVIAANAAALRAVDPVAVTGILTVNLHTLPAAEAAAIDEEIEMLQGLWPIGVTQAAYTGSASCV